jgi:hypothetical protein
LLGQGAKVRIARREFAEGVANANHWPTVELVVRQALALHPAAVSKTVSVLSAKPLLAA